MDDSSLIKAVNEGVGSIAKSGYGLNRDDLRQGGVAAALAAIRNAPEMTEAEIRQAARWSAQNQRRQRIVEYRRHQPVDAAQSAACSSAEAEVLRGEVAALLSQAMEGLPERDRMVLDLIFVQGLRGAEVGAALGVTPPRVTQLRNSAVRKLRDGLAVLGVTSLAHCF